MKANKTLLHKLRHSTKALAIPMTFLILFVTMIIMISITYTFAVEKVNTRSATLKIATAKQDMISFSDGMLPILWQPGSACTYEFSDSDGKLNVQPLNNSLTVSIADNQDISGTIFNGTVGQVTYELPYARSPETGIYLTGDGRTITNQSGSVLTQLGIENGAEHPEIQLRYRPTVSYAAEGVENGKVVNTIRVYIVNLNTSQEFGLYGKVPVKAICVGTQISTTSFSVDYAVQNVILTSALSGQTGRVSVPIACTGEGAIIHVEVVQSNIQIERCLR